MAGTTHSTGRNRSVRVVALCALLPALLACPPGPTNTPPKKKVQQLVIHMEVEPAHLVVMLRRDFWALRIASDNIFESLIRINPRTYRLEGELAKSWQTSDDGLIHTFQLRKKIRWHDGRPLTAADVKFTFDKLMDPQVRAAATRATLAPYIKHYAQLQPYTFRIVCKEASPFFLKALSVLDILPAHLLRKGDINTHPFLRKPVGTGPYRFVSWKSRRQIVLERNGRYWGPVPKIPRLVFRLVGNAEVALKLARRGELDFLPRIKPAHWVGQVRSDKAFDRLFVKTRHYPPGIMFIILNQRRALFQDTRVRRALALLLDLDTITSKILHGLMQRAGAMYWFKDPEYDKSIKPIPFDPQRAAKLLAEAGWRDSDGDGVLDRQGKKFRFTFLTVASSKNMQRWLTIYQQQLRKAGIQMSINPMDWRPYIDRLQKHKFDAGAMLMRLTGPHTDLYYQLHSSQAAQGQNYGGYKNPAADRLLESIRTEMDHARRRRMSLELQQLLSREMALIPLFSEMAPGLVSRKVRGVYTSALWYQPRDWHLRP